MSSDLLSSKPLYSFNEKDFEDLPKVEFETSKNVFEKNEYYEIYSGDYQNERLDLKVQQTDKYIALIQDQSFFLNSLYNDLSKFIKAQKNFSASQTEHLQSISDRLLVSSSLMSTAIVDIRQPLNEIVNTAKLVKSPLTPFENSFNKVKFNIQTHFVDIQKLQERTNKLSTTVNKLKRDVKKGKKKNGILCWKLLSCLAMRKIEHYENRRRVLALQFGSQQLLRHIHNDQVKKQLERGFEKDNLGKQIVDDDAKNVIMMEPSFAKEQAQLPINLDIFDDTAESISISDTATETDNTIPNPTSFYRKGLSHSNSLFQLSIDPEKLGSFQLTKKKKDEQPKRTKKNYQFYQDFYGMDFETANNKAEMFFDRFALELDELLHHHEIKPISRIRRHSIDVSNFSDEYLLKRLRSKEENSLVKKISKQIHNISLRFKPTTSHGKTNPFLDKSLNIYQMNQFSLFLLKMFKTILEDFPKSFTKFSQNSKTLQNFQKVPLKYGSLYETPTSVFNLYCSLYVNKQQDVHSKWKILAIKLLNRRQQLELTRFAKNKHSKKSIKTFLARQSDFASKHQKERNNLFKSNSHINNNSSLTCDIHQNSNLSIGLHQNLMDSKNDEPIIELPNIYCSSRRNVEFSSNANNKWPKPNDQITPTPSIVEYSVPNFVDPKELCKLNKTPSILDLNLNSTIDDPSTPPIISRRLKMLQSHISDFDKKST
eukprot:TRINITY_DN1588_c0_g2_i1.p1 TRINITY_DN1588_c0_g2~~TRINITY_DN1588_c0_g2_i1.p1  ORF type:complete len:719 (+),score=170.69 TRINITY_DN1588_c0_g2_i1:27-2159(+)